MEKGREDYAGHTLLSLDSSLATRCLEFFNTLFKSCFLLRPIKNSPT